MAFGILITGVFVVIASIFLWIRKRFLFFEENGFLYETPKFPFGNLKGVGKELHMAYRVKEMYEKFKGKAPLFGIYFFATPDVVLTDLDTIKNVLVRDFDYFRNRGIYSNAKDDPLSANMFSMEDQTWKNIRAKVTPTFTSGKMKMMFKTLVSIADNLVEQLENESNLNNIEVKERLAKFTTDVIGNIAFGLEMNAIKDPDSEFRRMGKRIFSTDANLQIKIFFMTSFQTLARKLGMRFFPEDVSEFFLRTIRETVEYREKNKIERNDVVDLLMKLKDDGTGQEGTISFNDLAALCFVFFFAGFETSSSTSCFVLYALALNLDIQEKLRKEIKSVLAKNNGELTYEAMQEMKYLQMVIDETLRMYGPIFQLVRTASRDYKVPNTNLTIRKGTLTMIPTYAIHNDAEIYPEPLKFDPERFNDENKRNRHPMAFLPFGDGPRACIGLRFGLMQTKVALIKLLTKFKFSASSSTQTPMRFDPKSLVLAAKDGMWLKVEKL